MKWPPEPVTLLRPSCRAAAGGDPVAGAVLSRAADLAVEHGGSFLRTYAEWAEDLGGLVNEKRIRAGVQTLAERGMLTAERTREGVVFTVDLERLADALPPASAPERPYGGSRTADTPIKNGHMADLERPNGRSGFHWPNKNGRYADQERPYGGSRTANAPIKNGQTADLPPQNGHMADLERPNGRSGLVHSARADARASDSSLLSCSEEREEQSARTLREITDELVEIWPFGNPQPVQTEHWMYQHAGEDDVATAERILADAKAEVASGQARRRLLHFFVKDWTPRFRPSAPAPASKPSPGSSMDYLDDPEWLASVTRDAADRGVR